MIGRDTRVVVAMTTCNAERFVGAQLESLLAQSVLPRAIVISDDASTDGTCEIVERFVRRSPIPIELLRNESRAGIIGNCERVYARAAEIGDVIVPADDDDIASAEKIEAVQAAFSSSSELAVWFSDGELISVDGEQLGTSLWEFVGLDEAGRRQLASGGGTRRLLHGATISGGSAAFRADVVQSAVPFPTMTAAGVPLFYPDGWLAVLGCILGNVDYDERRMLMYRRYTGQESDVTLLPTDGTTRDRWSDLRLHAARVRLVADRMRSCPRAAWNRDRAAEVTRLDRFLHARLLHPGWRRTTLLTRHLLRGDYARYARGVRTFVGDMIRTPVTPDGR